jgi:hypothetical protein
MRARHRRPGLATGPILALSVVLSGPLGCDTRGPAAVEELARRFITDPPVSLLDDGQLFAHRRTQMWRLGHPEDGASWQPTDLRRVPDAVSGAARFEVTGPRPALRFGGRLEASAVDRVTVVARGPAGPPRLTWTGNEGLLEPGTSGSSSHAFVVAGGVGWEGRVQGLEIVLSNPAGGWVEIDRIETSVRAVAPHRLRAATGRAWQVDLGHDVRSALLAPPGHVRAWSLEPGAEATLRFAYGVRPGAARRGAGVFGFEVLARPEGGREELLFSASLPEDGSPQAASWYEAAVDLDRFARRRTELVLRTTPRAGWAPWHALPVWGHPELRVRRAAPGEHASTRWNVILVSVDTLRADRLSLYGYARPTSPRIDAWARRVGIVFSQAVAQAPWTVPSHASMLSGLDALRHGVNHGAVPGSLTTLAEVLRAAGYTTAAMTGGAFLRPEFGFVQGFDTYRYASESGDDLASHVRLAEKWLASSSDRPFLLFLHTYAVHTPLRTRPRFTAAVAPDVTPLARADHVGSRGLPRRAEDGFRLRNGLRWIHERYPAAFDEHERAWLGALYDGGVAEADEQLGRVLEVLAETGLERETLVVLTSDHGEALGEALAFWGEKVRDGLPLETLVRELAARMRDAPAWKAVRMHCARRQLRQLTRPLGAS